MVTTALIVLKITVKKTTIAFQIVWITVLMAFITIVTTFLIAFHAEERKVLIPFTAVVNTFSMIPHIIAKKSFRALNTVTATDLMLSQREIQKFRKLSQLFQR